MRPSFFFLKIFLLLCIPSLFLVAQTEKKALSLDDIFNSGKFAGKGLNGVHWLKDGAHYSYLEKDTSAKATNIFVHDVKEKSSTLVLGHCFAQDKSERSTVSLHNVPVVAG